jgi:hypothetical protein
LGGQDRELGTGPEWATCVLAVQTYREATSCRCRSSSPSRTQKFTREEQERGNHKARMSNRSLRVQSFIDSYARCLDGLSEVGIANGTLGYQIDFPAKERAESLGQVHVSIKDSSLGKLRKGDNKIEVTGFRSEFPRCSGAKQLQAPRSCGGRAIRLRRAWLPVPMRYLDQVGFS